MRFTIPRVITYINKRISLPPSTLLHDTVKVFMLAALGRCEAWGLKYSFPQRPLS